MPSDCGRRHRAAPGDSCDKLAQRDGLTTAELAMSNPVLGIGGSMCATSFWFGYYYLSRRCGAYIYR
ncbi:hypothetical protein F5B21DRAFT_484292 [Xylaria acuta]|nr:hypothetical protein F5B21DRAFT_484292 [Xylaria acuta]